MDRHTQAGREREGGCVFRCEAPKEINYLTQYKRGSGEVKLIVQSMFPREQVATVREFLA